VAVLAEAVLFNFFALFAIGFSLVLALTGWGFGAMRRAEKRAADTGQVLRPDAQPMIEDDVARIEPPDHVTPQARNLLLPVAVMVAMIFVGLYVTGGGNLMEGSGSTAVLWAVGTALGAALLLYAIPRPLREGRATLTLGTSMDWVVKGASGLVPVTLLLVLAFALGQVSQALEMGDYVVQLVGEQGPAWWMPVLVFAVTSFVAFTSRPPSCWGPCCPGASSGTTPRRSPTPPSSRRWRRRPTTWTTSTRRCPTRSCRPGWPPSRSWWRACSPDDSPGDDASLTPDGDPPRSCEGPPSPSWAGRGGPRRP
jgi:hypothetical protein